MGAEPSHETVTFGSGLERWELNHVEGLIASHIVFFLPFFKIKTLFLSVFFPLPRLLPLGCLIFFWFAFWDWGGKTVTVEAHHSILGGLEETPCAGKFNLLCDPKKKNLGGSSEALCFSWL